MSVFKDTLWLSGEEWVDSFPTDIPKHHFSEKHNEIINEIILGKQEKTKHKLSKGTIKVLLIAAVLLAFATTAFAVPASRKYIIQKFSNHSAYHVINYADVKKVTSLNLNYIPTGFEMKEEHYSNSFYIFMYEKDDKYFSVDKYAINTTVNFDTEKYNCEDIFINDIAGILFKTANSREGIIFNNGEYIFIISGNIGKEELVGIAQNVE